VGGGGGGGWRRGRPAPAGVAAGRRRGLRHKEEDGWGWCLVRGRG
jgi:hypothetical protein